MPRDYPDDFQLLQMSMIFMSMYGNNYLLDFILDLIMVEIRLILHAFESVVLDL